MFPITSWLPQKPRVAVNPEKGSAIDRRVIAIKIARPAFAMDTELCLPLDALVPEN